MLQSATILTQHVSLQQRCFSAIDLPRACTLIVKIVVDRLVPLKATLLSCLVGFPVCYWRSYGL